MRLKRLFIENFGLFHNVSFDFDEGVTLFFGNNESGKTTLIDAILCGLYGFNKKVFPVWQERYDEGLKGELILSYNGQDISLPQKGKFFEISSLNPLYFKNVFCIRSGEVLLDKDDFRKKDWTNMLMNRILGMHGDLKSVIEELRKKAGITQNGERESRTKVWRDVEAMEREIESYEKRREKTESLFKRERERDIRIKELNTLEDNLSQEELNRKALEKAREKEELQRIKELHKEIKKKEEELDLYSHLKEEELKRWEGLVKEKEKLVNKSNIYKKRTEEVVAREKDLKDELRRLESLITKWQGIAETVVSLENDINQHNDLKSRTAGFKESKTIKKSIHIVQYSCVISTLFLALLGFIWKKEIWVGIFFTILIPVILVLFLKKRYTQAKEWEDSLNELFQKIQSVLRNLGEEWEDIDIGELENTIEKKRREVNRYEGELKEKKRQADALEKDRDNLETEIRSFNEEIEAADKDITAVKEKSGMVSLEQFQEKWAQFQTIKKDLDGLKKEMEGMIGKSDPDSIFDRIEVLEERLKEKEDIENISWDEEAYNSSNKKVSELRNEKEKQEKVLNNIKFAISELKGSLLGLNKMDILFELDKKTEELNDFLREREAAETAYFVMRDVEKETTQQVQEILQGRSSELFSKVTDSRYKKIIVKSWDLGDIMVSLPSGQEKPIEWLSTGTLNQLYMIMRLALAERSLKKRKGFLLLDDPFLTFDSGRVSRVLDILFDFVTDGWQIIFFTVDRTLRNLLEMRGVRVQVLRSSPLG